MKKVFLSFLILPLLTLSAARIALAETIEVSVSGNGESSQNTASVNTSNEANVTQTNEANISNEVNTDANTGNNTASDNTGEASVQTGDVNSETTINNENINSNVAAAGDCGCEQTTTEISVSGNGSDSTNNAGVSQGSTNNVFQSNNANITNNVNTIANTGYNSANNNIGNVLINTGDIMSIVSVTNKNINTNLAVGFGVNNSDLTIKIFGNGEASNNSVWVAINNIFNYQSNNDFNLTNLIWNNFNTGGNSANGNIGDVAINTGDIYSSVNVNNTGNNNSLVVSCDKEEEKPHKGEENPPSSNNPGNGGGPGDGRSDGRSDGRGGGSVLAAVTSEILPETGAIWLFLATLLASTLFLLGWFLRFSTGISPPKRV